MDKETYLNELTHLQAELCKAFVNPVRIAIIKVLSDGEESVSEIASKVGVPIQNISQHVKILKDAGIVGMRRDGHKIYYSLEDKRIVEICDLMKDILIEIMRKKASIFHKNIE